MKTVNFEIAGKPYSMVIPDDYLSEVCARDIIEGKSYPFPDWIKNPRVVVDIGGHAGEFSVLAKIMWPEATVHCYEPNPELISYLHENACRYGFEIHEYAVGCEWDEHAKLRVSGYGTVANSLIDRPNQTGAFINVRTIPASEIGLYKPDVMKVDAEGAEVGILTRLHLSDTELIYVEFHSEDDRFEIERIMKPTHHLFHARIGHKDQGELMYVRRKQ